MKENPDRLAQVRAEIIACDRQLLEIAQRRNELIEEVAAAKAAAATSGALFDRTRERLVYERAEASASEIGLPVAEARRLMQVVIEQSHRIQERIARDVARHHDARSATSMCIIGGKGRMGQRLAAAFGERGVSVDCYDLDDDRELEDLVAAADVVMIAVPMASAVKVVRTVAPHVRSDALLCDINSLKQDVCAAMNENCRGEVVGLHPMFGPTVHSLRRQKVVVCAEKDGPRRRWLAHELRQMGMELIETDATTHDRMMAVIQVLVHFSTLVMGDALRRCAIPIDESLRFTSPIYRLELSFLGRLFQQSASLYAEIEMTNPFGDEVRIYFLESAKAWEACIAAGDRSAFAQRFQQAHAYFHGFSDEAMALSDHIIDTLVQRP